MVILGGNPYSDNSVYSAEDRLQRNYCALVLIEFTVMAVVYYYAYSRKITPPNTPYANYITSKNGIGKVENPTLCWFVCEMLNFRDVFGIIALEEESSMLNLETVSTNRV